MDILHTAQAMNQWCADRKRQGRTIALVPTMGYLHAGHLSLVTRAKATADDIVVSIFVNPTQFGPTEDYACYPRKEEADCALCRDAGVAAIYLPSPEEMYPANASTWVEEATLSKGFCGASRPIHFRGVCTVVAKLFNIIMPDYAIFGQKDFQQVAVIKRMVRDLNFPIRIIRSPIIREADGLAMSSRNTYLSETSRKQALSLSQSLIAAQAAFDAGEKQSTVLEASIRCHVEASNWTIEYATVIDADTLEPISEVRAPAAILIAAKQGNIRLIDNRILCE